MIKIKTNESIQLEKFSNIAAEWSNKDLNTKWTELLKIRDKCNSSIEIKRASKEIGSSLEVNLDITLSDELIKFTEGVDFSELCITSGAKIEKMQNNESEGIMVKTNKAEGKKCPVCWKINTQPCKRHFS